MRLRVNGLAAVLSFATVLGAGSARGQQIQPNYHITDTGPLTPLGCGSGANQLINQSGQVAQTAVSHGLTSTGPTTMATTYFVTVGPATGTGLFLLTNPIATDIGSLFGYATFARAINPQGSIIGVSATTAQSDTYHAYLWTPTSGMIDLAPSTTAEVCGVNSRGDVVGDMATSDGPHAFVYTGGQTWDLNSIGVSGASVSVLRLALSINDVGQIFAVGLVNGIEHGFILTPTIANLLVDGGFEDGTPPAFARLGWVSDSLRALSAKSETNQPHRGTHNGACWATTYQDCGLYQELTAPMSGPYNLSFFANADRAGGFVGVNVNGKTVGIADVQPRGFGDYGLSIDLSFTATQGDTIRVWMYSPATPGYVVVDDVLLTFTNQRFF